MSPLIELFYFWFYGVPALAVGLLFVQRLRMAAGALLVLSTISWFAHYAGDVSSAGKLEHLSRLGGSHVAETFEPPKRLLIRGLSASPDDIAKNPSASGLATPAMLWGGDVDVFRLAKQVERIELQNWSGHSPNVF